MDICHLKNAELEAKHQKYKGRVVLRGDIVKTIQVLLHYSPNKDLQHLNWQRLRSWISFPDCLDAHYKQQTQYQLNPGKMEDAHKWLKIPKSECPDIWIRLPRHKWQKIMVQYGRPSCSSWAESVWSSFGTIVVRKAIWENYIGTRLGKKFPIGIASSYTAKKNILICVCGWHQIGWKETTYWSDVESTKQRSWFGRHHSLICISGMYSKTMWNKQRYCWQLQNTCLNPEFLQEQLRNYHARKICVFLRGPTIWKVMPRNLWNDIVSWRTKRLNNSLKYQLLALTTIISKKKKNWNPWENCQKYALRLSLNACTWHELEDPIFYGQWTNLHDRSHHVANDYLVWSLKFIIHVITNNIVMWENTAKQCRLGLFQDSDLQEILRIQNLHQVEHCGIFGSHTFVPISWMCKKQTSVSHSSTEAEIMSLDAGLRLDGIPALDLWDLIVPVLHGNTYQSNQERRDPHKSPTRKKIHGNIDDLDNVDFISSNVHPSRKEALL